MAKIDLIPTQIRLTPEQHEALRKLAYDTKISSSEHIRRAVEAYLKKPGK